MPSAHAHAATFKQNIAARPRDRRRGLLQKRHRRASVALALLDFAGWIRIAFPRDRERHPQSLRPHPRQILRHRHLRPRLRFQRIPEFPGHVRDFLGHKVQIGEEMGRRREGDDGLGLGIVEEGPLFLQVRRQRGSEGRREGHRGKRHRTKTFSGERRYGSSPNASRENPFRASI